MAKTEKFEAKFYVHEVSWNHNPEQYITGACKPPTLEVTLGSDSGTSRLRLEGHPSVTAAFMRAYHKNKTIKLTIEADMSDIEEARELLANGQDKQAITKALDILERLDK
jgi:hypothetical protein